MFSSRFALAFAISFAFLAAGDSPGRADARTAPVSATGTTVVMYGASWCPACSRARELLDSLGVPYVERNVDEDAVQRELVEYGRAHGFEAEGIPVLDIGGTAVQGFDADAIGQAVFGQGLGTAARALAEPARATLFVPKQCGTECSALVAELESRGARVTVRSFMTDPRARAELDRRLRAAHRAGSTSRTAMVFVEDRAGGQVVLDASLVRWALTNR